MFHATSVCPISSSGKSGHQGILNDGPCFQVPCAEVPVVTAHTASTNNDTAEMRLSLSWNWTTRIFCLGFKTKSASMSLTIWFVYQAEESCGWLGWWLLARLTACQPWKHCSQICQPAEPFFTSTSQCIMYGRILAQPSWRWPWSRPSAIQSKIWTTDLPHRPSQCYRLPRRRLPYRLGTIPALPNEILMYSQLVSYCSLSSWHGGPVHCSHTSEESSTFNSSLSSKHLWLRWQVYGIKVYTSVLSEP